MAEAIVCAERQFFAIFVSLNKNLLKSFAELSQEAELPQEAELSQKEELQ